MTLTCYFEQVRVTANDQIRHPAKMAIDMTTANQFIDDALGIFNGLCIGNASATDARNKLVDVSISKLCIFPPIKCCLSYCFLYFQIK